MAWLGSSIGSGQPDHHRHQSGRFGTKEGRQVLPLLQVLAAHPLLRRGARFPRPDWLAHCGWW